MSRKSASANTSPATIFEPRFLGEYTDSLTLWMITKRDVDTKITDNRITFVKLPVGIVGVYNERPTKLTINGFNIGTQYGP